MGKTIPNYPRGLTFEQVWASIQELKEFQKETAIQMRETDRKIGDLSNSFGELAEHLVGPSIMEKFNELGFNFTRRSSNVKIKTADNPNTYTEVDLMLENGDVVIAVEVKARPKEKYVEKHIQRMEVIRQVSDRVGDRRKYLGAIAGAITNEAINEYILQNGFYLIEQTGDTVKLTIPEGFIAREW